MDRIHVRRHCPIRKQSASCLSSPPEAGSNTSSQQRACETRDDSWVKLREKQSAHRQTGSRSRLVNVCDKPTGDARCVRNPYLCASTTVWARRAQFRGGAARPTGEPPGPLQGPDPPGSLARCRHVPRTSKCKLRPQFRGGPLAQTGSSRTWLAAFGPPWRPVSDLGPFAVAVLL